MIYGCDLSVEFILPEDAVSIFILLSSIAVFIALGLLAAWVSQQGKIRRLCALLEDAVGTPGHGLIFFDQNDQFILANKQANSYLPILSSGRHVPTNLNDFLDYMYDNAIENEDSFLKTSGLLPQKTRDIGFREMIRGAEGGLYLAEAQRTENKHTVLIIMDISTAHQQEEQVMRLRQFNNNLYHAIEAATNGIMIVRAQDKMYLPMFINKAFCNIVKMDRQDVMSSSFLDVFRIVEDEDQRKKIGQLIEEGKGGDMELCFRSKDSPPSWYALKLAPVLDGTQNASNLFISVLTDLTELKQREAEFFKSQKLEALGQLAAGVAHDFNNVLSIIDGYSRLAIKDLPEGVVAKDYLERIGMASQRGANLIKQMLTFSRHKIVVETVIDLGETLQAQNTLLLPLLGASIHLNIFTGDRTMNVECSEDTIVQILMNLVVNARDSMPKGGSLILETRVCNNDELPRFVRDKEKARGDEQERQFACLSVTDSGTGMKQEVVERIFDPFYTTKEQGKGTGLGLSMVYGLVTQIGGYIDVKSSYGAGTSMLVYLPLTDKLPNRTLSGLPQDAQSLRFDGFTALISEDEPDLLRLVSSMLEKLGMKVLRASNGHEALVMQDEYNGKIDVLLTDVVMPEMDGVELVELVRSLRPDIKVIFMSGYPQGAQPRVSLPENAFFVAKPVQYEVLAHLIHQRLSEKDNGDSARVGTARWKSEPQDMPKNMKGERNENNTGRA